MLPTNVQIKRLRPKKKWELFLRCLLNSFGSYYILQWFNLDLTINTKLPGILKHGEIVYSLFPTSGNVKYSSSNTGIVIMYHIILNMFPLGNFKSIGLTSGSSSSSPEVSGYNEYSGMYCKRLILDFNIIDL